jgi:hypothetical protein
MVDGEIRRNEQAVERCLLAFEAGTLQAEVCGDRVRVLTEATAGLRTRREELVVQLEGAGRSGGTQYLGLDLRGLLEEAMAAKPVTSMGVVEKPPRLDTCHLACSR